MLIAQFVFRNRENKTRHLQFVLIPETSFSVGPISGTRRDSKYKRPNRLAAKYTAEREAALFMAESEIIINNLTPRRAEQERTRARARAHPRDTAAAHVKVGGIVSADFRQDSPRRSRLTRSRPDSPDRRSTQLHSRIR